MKVFQKFLFLFLVTFSLQNCSLFENPECLSDLAVTALDAPSSIISGNVIGITCVIKNVAQNLASCSASGDGTARVTCAYSPTYQDNFSDYTVFDEQTVPLGDSYETGEGQTDKMSMPTDYGAGYYAMKVEVDSDNEVPASASSRSSENNDRAIVIRAD